MAAPLTAPRTSFNGTITGHRTIGMVDMSLDDIKAVKTATGATVNDVVLAVAGGALRSYLLDRDELPESSLLATVPMSVRETSKRETGANKVSALFTRLGTDVEDPLERLEELAQSNRHAKDHAQAISADSLQDWAEFAAPRTFGLAVRAYAGLRLAEKHPVVHNLVISNVPGPPIPLYFMGAEIMALVPLGPVFHGAGVNVTVMSNNGKMHVGIIACRESMPDVDDLAQRFPAELAKLKAAVRRSTRSRRRSGGRRPRRSPRRQASRDLHARRADLDQRVARVERDTTGGRVVLPAAVVTRGDEEAPEPCAHDGDLTWGWPRRSSTPGPARVRTCAPPPPTSACRRAGPPSCGASGQRPGRASVAGEEAQCRHSSTPAGMPSPSRRRRRRRTVVGDLPVETESNTVFQVSRTVPEPSISVNVATLFAGGCGSPGAAR